MNLLTAVRRRSTALAALVALRPGSARSRRDLHRGGGDRPALTGLNAAAGKGSGRRLRPASARVRPLSLFAAHWRDCRPAYFTLKSVRSHSSLAPPSGSGGLLLAALATSLTALAVGEDAGAAHAAPASDDRGAGNEDRQPNSRSISGLLPEGVDVQSLSLAAGVGVVPGFCAGFALRKVGNIATFMVGGVFFMFQLAAYKGYVTIHWEEVEKDLNSILDYNRDGNVDGTEAGTISEDKVHEVVNMLTHNTKGTLGGFAGGFFMGWRAG